MSGGGGGGLHLLFTVSTGIYLRHRWYLKLFYLFILLDDAWKVCVCVCVCEGGLYHSPKSINLLTDSARNLVNLPCCVVPQCSTCSVSFVMAHYVQLDSLSLSLSLSLVLSLSISPPSLYFSLSLSLSPARSYTHTNQRWVTIIAPSLRHTKNLFHTHTYTNTHLHSAAVCAHIQCPSAREEIKKKKIKKNIQCRQISR